MSASNHLMTAVRTTGLFGAAALCLCAGYWLRGAVTTPSSADTAPAQWTCSMHPEIQRSMPGACPKCGMALVPDPTGPRPHNGSPRHYACSMFCTTLSQPGRCPICGMDMVEVVVDAADASASTARLTLSERSRQLADIQVRPVERRFVDTAIRMVGKVDYDESRVRHITAWVPGRLDRMYVDYTGVPVRPGDHLVTIYSPELLTAQQELLQAIKASRDLERSDVTSVRESAHLWIDDIREKFRLWGMTEDQIADIERRDQPSDHMTIYAPIGGIVIDKNAVEGKYVQTGARIYTIADLSRVWVKLDAYESDLEWLRYGQAVRFETEAYPGKSFTGTIAFIDPVLDGRTRTIKVRVNVDNADGRLKPHLFVRATVAVRIAEGGIVIDNALAGKWISPMHPEVVKDAPGSCDVCGMPLVRAESLGFSSASSARVTPPLVIPASAPLITGTRAVVYVQDSDDAAVYRGREITLGARAGAFYIVSAGLEEGERVVVNGNFKIDSAMQIMARPSMMTGTPPKVAAPPVHTTQSEVVPTAEYQERLDELLDAYLAIQQALSADRLTDAVAAAETIVSIAAGDDHTTGLPCGDLRSSGAQLIAAEHIDPARAAFALLSESMIAVVSARPAHSRTLYRIHCPMAFDNRGADWLQVDMSVTNPYFGATMLRCGTVREKYGLDHDEHGAKP